MGGTTRAPKSLTPPRITRQAARPHSDLTYYHGTPDERTWEHGAAYGIHVGTEEAAHQALNARIGRPLEGKWDGTREYGKTLLSPHQRTGEERNLEAPRYPSGRATYSTGHQVPMDARPSVFPVRITGPMVNHHALPVEDDYANSRMHGQITRGNARRGYFYRNIGEDEGSISAVVPSAAHLERVHPPKQAASEAPYVVYHGAHHEDVPGITARGLERRNDQPTVTTSREGAELYGRKRDWTAPKVLEIHVPRSQASRYLEEGEEGLPVEGTVHALREALPPEFIRAVHDVPQGRTASRWSPSSGIFGPTTGLDPRLFDEAGELRPEVRAAILDRVAAVTPLEMHVWLAGGSASEWAGSRPGEQAQDLDVLTGLPAGGERDASDMNAVFRHSFNRQGWHAPFGGTWDVTAYCNPAVTDDITVIRPYAAYDVTEGHWAVRPPHLPAHSITDFDPAVVAHARAVAAEARAVLRMPEPLRTREARDLWEHVHHHRCVAFSGEGTGWDDPGNVDEKMLAYAPRHLLDQVRELALAKTASAASVDYSHLHDPQAGSHAIVVHPAGAEQVKQNRVGRLSWGPEGRVVNLWVHPDYQRQGIATEMYRQATEISPGLRHAGNPTDDGRAWIEGMEAKTAAWHHDTSGSDHSGVYLRFGDWPHDERSYSPAGGYHEEGVSVYDLDRDGDPSIGDGLDRWHDHDEHCEPDCDLDEENADNDPQEEMGGRQRRAEHARDYGRDNDRDVGHLVRGEMTGVGYDGEPLLKSVRRVGDWIDHRHLFLDQAGPHRLARDPSDEDYEEPEEKPPYGDRHRTAAVQVSYEHRPSPSHFEPHEISARHPGASGDEILEPGEAGRIQWHADTGEVANVHVHRDYRRQGIATELWSRARQADPGLRHSKALSPDAKDWISGMQGKAAALEGPAPYEGERMIRGTHDLGWGANEWAAARREPWHAAAKLAQAQVRHDHPKLSMRFPRSHEGGDEMVGHMLRHVGYQGSTEGAFVARHPDPSRMTSNPSWLAGKPGVALHPERWDYGTVAHEAAHHAVMYDHGVGPSQYESDEASHGPEWAGHYAAGLNRVSKNAGDDFLAHHGFYRDMIDQGLQWRRPSDLDDADERWRSSGEPYPRGPLLREGAAAPGTPQRPKRTPGSAMVYLDVPHGTVQSHEGHEAGHHVALAYLPRKISDEDFGRVLDRAREAATRHAPMKATLSGAMTFPPGTPSDRRRASVVPVSAPGIHELHDEFRDFDRAHYEAYAPHVTRAQLGGHQADPEPHPEVSFPVTHVHVRRGDEVHSFPLTGRERTAAREESLDVGQLPVEQRRGLTKRPVYYPADYHGDTRMLDLAKDPRPGTRVWRGELRPAGEDHRDVSSVGMHWSVDPSGTLLRYPEEGYHRVVWQARVDDPGGQAFPRDHPVWEAHGLGSTDREAEVRFRPGQQVHVDGAYVHRGQGPAGDFSPLEPGRRAEGWEWHPVGRPVTVRHRPGPEGSPTRGGSDYAPLGISHEGAAVKGEAAYSPPQMPPRQRAAHGQPDFEDYRRDILDVAKDPEPGTVVWRSEQRPRGEDPRPGSVGIHWTVNPDQVIHFPDTGTHRTVVYQGRLRDPGSQAIPRSHPVWSGQHRSMDSEAEVRLRPGASVHVEGTWTPGVPSHARREDGSWEPRGSLVPMSPERMEPGHWRWNPVGADVPVRHAGQGYADYSDVGIHREAVSGYDGLTSRSGMIYLDLPPGTVRPVPGGTDDHHVTLVYLGKDVSDEAFEEACRRTGAAAARLAPMDGVLRGIDVFPPSKGSDGKVVAFVPAYVGGVGALRRELEDLSASEHKDYRPHVTLAYMQEGDSLPAPHPAVPLHFSRVHVKRGDDVASFPLGGKEDTAFLGKVSAMSQPSFYHGSYHDIEPGEELTPDGANEAGRKYLGSGEKHVFYTDDMGLARSYGPKVYRVQPIAPPSGRGRDNKRLHDPEPGFPREHEYLSSRGFRVVERVPDEEAKAAWDDRTARRWKSRGGQETIQRIVDREGPEGLPESAVPHYRPLR